MDIFILMNYTANMIFLKRCYEQVRCLEIRFFLIIRTAPMFPGSKYFSENPYAGWPFKPHFLTVRHSLI